MGPSAIDRLDILDLLSRADDYATARDVDRYMSLLSDDVVLDGAQGTSTGTDGVRQAVTAIWAAEPEGTRHLATTVSVRAEDSRNAVTRSTLLLVSGSPPQIASVATIVQHVRKADGV